MIHWGIIGAGNIAHRFAKSLENSQKGQLYAVGSHTQEKLKEFQSLYPLIQAYSDYDALLDDEDVDAVYIATWHNTHYQWAKQALEKGKAVLCEKPATLSSLQTKELAQIAKDNHVLFIEGMKTRFVPMILELKRLLSEGLIGDILEVHNRFCYDIRGVKDTRYLFDEKQGGILNDVGSYTIASLLDYIHDDIIDIKCQTVWNQGVDVHDVVTVTFAHQQKGIMEMAMDEAKTPEMIIIGTKGKITCSPFYRPTEVTIHLDHQKPYTMNKEYINDDFYTEIEEVHTCLEKGLIESPRMTLQDSIACIELTEKIKERMVK